MAKQLQLRRGTTSEHGSFTGATGEVTVDTTKDTVVVHDGSTAGGFPLLRADVNNLADDAVSLNKVNGGTLGTGTIGGSSVVNTAGAITTSSNDGIAVNSGSHGYIRVNSSATNTASWFEVKQGGTGRWIIGCEGNETDFQFYELGSSGSRFRIAQGGNVTVHTGNLVIGSAGMGIAFSATNTPAQSTGTGSHNTLDDYEEGTFFMTCVCSTSGSYTVSPYNKFNYTKIGRLCHVKGYYSTNADNSASGDLRFSLPFAVSSGSGLDADYGVGCMTMRGSGVSGQHNITARWSGGATYFNMRYDDVSGGADSTLTNAGVDGSGFAGWIGFSYTTA